MLRFIRLLTFISSFCRELFERALTLKNTKFFFKKYIKFEEKYGTEETQARLRSRIEEELWMRTEHQTELYGDTSVISCKNRKGTPSGMHWIGVVNKNWASDWALERSTQLWFPVENRKQKGRKMMYARCGITCVQAEAKFICRIKALVINFPSAHIHLSCLTVFLLYQELLFLATPW